MDYFFEYTGEDKHSSDGVFSDELYERVTLNVCWSLKRWSVCIGLRHTSAGEGERAALNEHAHSSVSRRGCFLQWISVTFASDSQSHHSKHSQALKYYSYRAVARKLSNNGVLSVIMNIQTLYLCCFIFNTKASPVKLSKFIESVEKLMVCLLIHVWILCILILWSAPGISNNSTEQHQATQVQIWFHKDPYRNIKYAI